MRALRVVGDYEFINKTPLIRDRILGRMTEFNSVFHDDIFKIWHMVQDLLNSFDKSTKVLGISKYEHGIRQFHDITNALLRPGKGGIIPLNTLIDNEAALISTLHEYATDPKINDIPDDLRLTNEQVESYCKILRAINDLFDGKHIDGTIEKATSARYNLAKFLSVLNSNKQFFAHELFINGKIFRSPIIQMIEESTVWVLKNLGDISAIRIAMRNILEQELVDKKIVRAEDLKSYDGILTRYMHDLFADPLGLLGDNNKMGMMAYKVLLECRWVMVPLKYTLSVGNGILLGLSNGIYAQIYKEALGSGCSGLINSKELTDFMNFSKILKSEWALEHDKVNPEIGESLVRKMFKKLTPDNVAGKATAQVLAGGLHNIVDLWYDNSMKRTCVANALRDCWVSQFNMDKFIKWAESGNIHYQHLLTLIRERALNYYSNYRTVSNVTVLNRSIFSRAIMFNFMGNYMIRRTTQITGAIAKLARDITHWNISIDYFAKAENSELRALLMNAAYSAKFAVYMNHLLNGSDPDQQNQTEGQMISKYIQATSDFYSSAIGSFMGRMIKSVAFDGPAAYQSYMDYTGKTQLSVWDKAKVDALYGLQSITQAMFRELAIANIGITSVDAAYNNRYGDGVDMITTMNTLDEQLDSIMNGLWRFFAMPWLETQGLKYVPQNDDYFTRIMMNFDINNKSANNIWDLRDAENVSKFLNGKTGDWTTAMNVIINNQSLIKNLMWAGEGTAFSKWLYDTITQEMAKDPILKNLQNGIFDPGVITDKNRLAIFKQLTSTDIANYQFDKNGKIAMNSYGLTDDKLSTFVTYLDNQLGWNKMEDYIKWVLPDQNRAALAEILALAENKIPGSAAVVLSYYAQQTEENLVKYVNMQNGLSKYSSGSYKNLSPEENNKIMDAVINMYYPGMYIADKESWQQLMQQRMLTLHPNIAKVSSDDLKLPNQLAYLDWTVYNQAKDGNPNAQLIKSAYSLASKYTEDPVDRLTIFNHTMATVNELPISHEVKNVIWLGISLGNIDNLSNVLKDAKLTEANKQMVHNAIDYTFGTYGKLMHEWSSLLPQWLPTNLQDLDKALKTEEAKQWYGSRWSSGYTPSLPYSMLNPTQQKSYGGGSYGSSNGSAHDQFASKLPELYKNIPTSYRPSQTVQHSYDPFEKFSFANAPKIYPAYLQFKQEQQSMAASSSLVSGYVERFPWDSEQQRKSAYISKPVKWLPIKTISLGRKTQTFKYTRNPQTNFEE